MKSTPFDLKVLRHLVYTPTSPGCEVALGTMLVASIATTLKAPAATTAQTESDWRQSFFPVVLPHSEMLPKISLKNVTERLLMFCI